MWRSMCGRRRVPFSPTRNSKQIAGRECTYSRFCTGRPVWSRRACGPGARLRRWRRRSGSAGERVDDCADYLLHYSPYLQYDKALAEGVPIATGVIEGTCRHLVEDRMNLTGARWRLTGAEAVLRLRALRSSNDFDAYWKFHEQ